MSGGREPARPGNPGGRPNRGVGPNNSWTPGFNGVNNAAISRSAARPAFSNANFGNAGNLNANRINGLGPNSNPRVGGNQPFPGSLNNRIEGLNPNRPGSGPSLNQQLGGLNRPGGLGSPNPTFPRPGATTK